MDNTSALLERVPQLAILVGHEPHLPRALRAGGAGTICGVANTYPAIVRALFSPTVRRGRRRADRDVHRHRVPPALSSGVQGDRRGADARPRMARAVPAVAAARRRRAATLFAALADAGMPADAGCRPSAVRPTGDAPTRSVRYDSPRTSAEAMRRSRGRTRTASTGVNEQRRKPWLIRIVTAVPKINAVACCRRASARRRSGRSRGRGSSPRHAQGDVRLEEIQGREDRSVPGEEPARRSAHQVPQGIRGHDGNHRRLRDDSRAAAAAEGRDRVQFRQHELRRDRASRITCRSGCSARTSGWRTSGRCSPTSRSPIPNLDFADFSKGGMAWATQADGRIDSLPFNIDPWVIYYNKELFDAKKRRVSEELSRDRRRRGEAQRSGQGRLRLRRRAASRMRTCRCGRASCWATAAPSSTPTASSRPRRRRRSTRRRCTRRCSRSTARRASPGSTGTRRRACSCRARRRCGSTASASRSRSRIRPSRASSARSATA